MLESREPPKSTAQPRWWTRLAGLMKDPTARFFALGALLFVAHRLVGGEERAIAVTPGVRADLERKFRDHKGQKPTAAELSQALNEWKRDEALYREALREQLDRHDPTIRTVLADKMRARAALAVTPREPSDAELQGWLDSHPALYEMPRRYEYESVAFPKAESSARELRDAYLRALHEGKDPRTLGRPIVGGRLTAEVLRQRLGPALAELISGLPPARWERAENESSLLLVRLKGVQGGLPPLAEVRSRVKDDLLAAERQRAVDRAVQAIVGRYHFEESE
jgi:hypothetical protein